VDNINELHTNLLGKIFYGAVTAWLVGKACGLKIRGTQSEIDAVTNAMVSSRRFQDELSRPGATVESVFEKLAFGQRAEGVLGVAVMPRPTLQSLNAKIAIEGQDAKQVATAYLKSKRLLK